MAISDLEMADLVQEACYDEGAGPLILAGPPPGFRAFADIAGPETRFPYAILGVDRRGEWETGVGRIDGQGRLERMPGASSAGGGAVHFSAGEKQVLLTPDARWFEAVNAHGHAIGEIEGLATAISGRQAASDGLTAIAALPTTAFGRGGLIQGDAAAFRSYIGAGTSSSSGTVTSISGSGGTTGLTLAGGPVTGSGTLTLSGTLSVANGGSGATSAADARSNFGLGTAAVHDVGPSGSRIPLLDGLNQWGATQTFSANIRVNGPGIGNSAYMYLSSPNASGNGEARVFIQTNMSHRWTFGKNSAAESGGNTGSNFAITSWDDAAAFIRSNLEISRATGVMAFGGTIHPSADNSMSVGTASRRWSEIFAGTGVVSTSDRRVKRDIQPISEDLLGAWAGVVWTAYRFKDAYAAKGEGARWHMGLIAQQVRDVIDAKMGVGAAVRLGLVCHDAWDAVAADHDEDGNETMPARPAGERWSLRYEECLAVESAYQRRRIGRIEAMIAAMNRDDGDVAG
ncbi:MAG: tail fiber domain-containing protein [Sphingobium sp.]